MPHQCIGCEMTYEDGSESVLSGCTECGGTTFQFIPSSQLPDNQPDSDQEANWMGGGVIDTDGDDAHGSSPSPSPSPSESVEAQTEFDDENEDASQRAARTDVIDADELPNVGNNKEEDASQADVDNVEVDIETLRQELNRQFEGIEVRSPGQYEINLTRLFEREECVITLKDDGQYVISMPGEQGDDPDVRLND